MSTKTIRLRKPNGHLPPVAELLPVGKAVLKALAAANDPAEAKLTFPAYMAAALRLPYPDATYAEGLKLARALREEIYAPGHTDRFQIQACIRRMMVGIRTPNWPRPPRNAAEAYRLDIFLDRAIGGLTEVVMLKTTMTAIFAVAVLAVHERFGDEAFGRCTDYTAYERRLIDLAVQRDEVYAQIEKALTIEDLDLSRQPVTVKMTAGKIAVGPNLGERLVNWALAEENAPPAPAEPPPPAPAVRRVPAPS